MAEYREQAVFSIIDQATGPLRVIDAELKKIQKTMAALNSTKSKAASGISKAVVDDLNPLKRAQRTQLNMIKSQHASIMATEIATVKKVKDVRATAETALQRAQRMAISLRATIDDKGNAAVIAKTVAHERNLALIKDRSEKASAAARDKNEKASAAVTAKNEKAAAVATAKTIRTNAATNAKNEKATAVASAKSTRADAAAITKSEKADAAARQKSDRADAIAENKNGRKAKGDLANRLGYTLGTFKMEQGIESKEFGDTKPIIAGNRAIARMNDASAKLEAEKLAGVKRLESAQLSSDARVSNERSRANAKATRQQLEDQSSVKQRRLNAFERGTHLVPFGIRGGAETAFFAGGRAAHAIGTTAFKGMTEGSSAREQFYQSGNENVAGLAKSVSSNRRKFGSSNAEVTKEFAETTPFTHDASIQAEMVANTERMKTLTVARGGTSEQATAGSILINKGLDMTGAFRPDAKTGEIDLDKFRRFSNAIMGVAAVEGANFKPTDLRNLIKYGGSSTQTMDETGLTSLMLRGTEISGSTAGVQVRAFDRAVTGAGGSANGKIPLANLIANGFAVKDADGRVHAADEGVAGKTQFSADQYQYAEDKGIAAMKKKGLDPTNREDVRKFVSSMKLNNQVAAFITDAINNQGERHRGLKNIKKARTSEQEAIDAKARSTTSALDQLDKSVKNVGTTMDAGAIGNGFRAAINGITSAINNVDAVLSGSSSVREKLGALGVAVSGAAVAFAGFRAIGVLNPLNASAVALNESAAALTVAAERLGAGGALGKGGAAGAGAVAAGETAAVAGGGAAAIAAGGVAAYIGADLYSAWTDVSNAWTALSASKDEWAAADKRASTSIADMRLFGRSTRETARGGIAGGDQYPDKMRPLDAVGSIPTGAPLGENRPGGPKIDFSPMANYADQLNTVFGGLPEKGAGMGERFVAATAGLGETIASALKGITLQVDRTPLPVAPYSAPNVGAAPPSMP